MIRNVEVCNGVVIQKITKPDGSVIRYQTVVQSSLGDTNMVTPYSSLLAARLSVGWKPKHGLPESLTKPKAAYIQNTKGYRADSQRHR